MLAPRNRRRLTGRTNLKQMEEQETKASLERKRQAKQREKERRKGSRPRDSDEEVVDKLVGDLKERFYERGSLAKSFLQLDKDYSGSISVDEFSTFFKNLGHSLTSAQLELLLAKTDSDNNKAVDLEEFCSNFDVLTDSLKQDQGFSNVNTAIGELEAHHEREDKDSQEADKLSDKENGDDLNSSEGLASTSHDHSAEHDDVTVRVHSIISQLKRKVAQKGSMRTVFREYDANHDGSISRDEFRDALNNLNLRVTDKELDALLGMVDSHHEDHSEIMYDDFCAKFGDEQQGGGMDLGVHSLPDFTSAKHKAARLTPKLTELAHKLQSGSGLVCYHKVLKAFRDFDTDGAGMISRDDFRFAVDRVSRLGATTGASSSVAGWEHEVDTKGGGYVDYVAFVERLRQAGVSKPADFFWGATRQPGGGGRDPRQKTSSSNQESFDSTGSAGSTSPAWVQSPMQRPTRFEKSMKLRYKNTSYITCPQEGSPSFVSSEERFRTTRQSGLVRVSGSAHQGSGKQIPEAKAERIRNNQRRIELTLKEEATRKAQQEAARIDSLFHQRQNYLDRVNQASSIGQPKGVRNGTQVGVSQTNILTGLTE
ncbi:hypothetical protein HOP50_09g57480 [Chloropicon primus]|uniref:EF-hand domain-containing protein n=1 Tax=Chloropicon primus TaxID=1764295 RepID=A0A5B8MR63_9CHLO|nr:hypothetical protein A3770_09p57260 [Chloropicon primus]UPR02422.1 hypothetical protein HOP50_09g57480 [Chloropicon primus]|eukprot:QDZ23208.1 hypothetical protein A3770_09p57260 [Chloropicon primus]